MVFYSILTPLNMSSENSIDTSSERANSPILGGMGRGEISLIDSTIVGVQPHTNATTTTVHGVGDLPDNLIATIMRDTTKKLESLTNDLNQSDEEYENNQQNQNIFINHNVNNMKVTKKNEINGSKMLKKDSLSLEGNGSRENLVINGTDADDEEDDGEKFSHYICRGSPTNGNGDNLLGNNNVAYTDYKNGTSHVEFLNFNHSHRETQKAQAAEMIKNSEKAKDIVKTEVENDELQRGERNYMNGDDEDGVDGFHGNDFMLESIDLNGKFFNIFF